MSKKPNEKQERTMTPEELAGAETIKGEGPGGGDDGADGDDQKTQPQNESEMRTLIASVWKNTIDPKEMRKHQIGEKTKIEPEATIVTASSVPEAALDATLLGPDGEHGLPPGEAGKAKTIAVVVDTKRAKTGAELPQTIMQPGGGQDEEPAPGGNLKTASAKAKASTVAEIVSPPKSRGSSVGIQEATAGALVKAAQDLASASLSKLVVQQKNVVHSGIQSVPEGTTADYEIQRQLGEGGMGMVFSARQTSIDRDIALKMIKPNVAQDKDIQTVFLAEAAVTGDLEHPNIIPIYELGVQENGVLFYSMKHAKGVEWKGVLKKKSVEENIDILMKCADAVAFAHSKGIIHRDLKPENIMLGEFGEVLVMDWGLAAAVVEDGKIGKITKATAAGGTPAYMAPEMCTGQVDLIGYQSDVYLLGAILYEIVTGVRPHYADNMMDLLYNVATNKIQPSKKKGELVNIALRAMATHPKQRYPDVKSFQKAVRDTQKHYESINMANEAMQRLKKASESKEYEAFAQALFGFQEALRLWDRNKVAQQGATETRVAYAQCAIDKEDLDLAVSLVEPVRAEFPQLSKEITRRIAARDARKFRIRMLSYTSVALVAIFLIGMTVAYFLVEGKRQEALEAKDRADKEKQEAIKQTKIADEERGRAMKAKEEAERQKGFAEKQREEAESQKAIAERQKAEADKQRVEAEKQRSEAEKQKAEADKQRQNAEQRHKEAVAAHKAAEAARKEAEKRRKEADDHRKVAEQRRKEAEEQRKIAEDRFAELQKIGGLKRRIQRSLTMEEAQALQAKAAKDLNVGVLKKVALGNTQLELALIPAGEFVMGSDIVEPYRSAEEYLHAVKLTKPFYMGKHEVTQAQWFAVMGQSPKSDFDAARDGNLPVVDISHTEVLQQFLPKIQQFAPDGYVFRLPTEAEWEYACRSGSYGTYNRGTAESLGDYAWFQDNSKKSLHPVAQKEPNAWGLHDMHGNASELCMDYHDLRFYLSPKKEDPLNLKVGKYRVVRGGSWINLLQHCRSAYRSYVHPENKYDHLGLRLAMVKE